ncbi:hypothetical protein HA402_004816 [Bradysia odoriphaga]|nr:hypothetical protein HA402_004816 [Bradysia odoriphaga]
MKLSNFLLVLVLFSMTADAIGFSKNNVKCEKNVTFSVVKTWQSYTKNEQCFTLRNVAKADDDKFKEGLQGYYDGCLRATSNYRGNSHDLAHTVMKSFEAYLEKLIYFSNSNSTILSSCSEAILKSISILDKLDGSSMQVVKETGKVFPIVVNGLNEVALSLSDHIGNLSDSFKDAVDELGSVYLKYIKDVRLSCRLFKCTKKVDFVPTLKKSQKLMNTVALIAETLLSQCEADVQVQEAVLVLTLIVWWLTIAVQGINCAVQDVLIENNCTISHAIELSSISFDYVLVSTTEAISAVVWPFTKIIRDVLAVFVNITMALNSAVKDILGLFDGVSITVADITRNLFKSLEITSATKGVTNILRGLIFK